MEKKKNLAESLDNILRIIEGCCCDACGDVHVDPSSLEAFGEETAFLGERLGLEPFQAVLFAVILQIQSGSRCNISRVAQCLGMSYLSLLSYSCDLYALRSRGLIRIKGTSDISVPAEVIQCVMKDHAYEKPPVEGLSTKALLNRIFNFVRRVKDGEYNIDQAVEEIEILLDANPQTSYAAACLKYNINHKRLPPVDRFIFHTATFLYLTRDFTVFDMDDFEPFISDEETLDSLRDMCDSENLALQIIGVIEPAKADGFLEKGSFSLKEEIVKEMLSDIRTRQTTIRTVDLQDLADKPEKRLFYNPEEKGQIERLGSLLEEDSLKRVFSSMKDKGLRTGLICLFYGDPGTGKTETVYQLARHTGRKIMEADVAKLRNCYVGETEKNMRGLFADYRTACRENDLAPILLFNEADAILGTRMEGAVKSVDRMENSVQNILLQEMESFEGIMIATTNLLGNLDPAFERRFLFKIRFSRPELEPRALIWKSQFPSLTDDEARLIAGEFPFSGGQIENVVRKYTIDGILSGEEGGYDALRQYCREESVGRQTARKIGF